MGFAINGVQVHSTAAELNTLEGVLSGSGINYYVTKTGNDSNNDGLSWGQAFKTIQNAMDVITARGAERGRATVFVGPGGYNENVITPLNSIAPFGQLVAVNPTKRSFGATYIYAATATSPTLTIRARGWLVDGFEIAGQGSGGAILLDGATANSNAAGAEIRNCLIEGWAAGTFGINVTKNGAPLTTIKNCVFSGIVGPAIKCTESGTDQPAYWDIDGCTFVNNSSHINMNPRGFKWSQIRNCTFIQDGAARDATVQLDNRGGTGCIIGPGNILSDTYDNTGGFYAGSVEFWRGNHHEDSAGLPSGTGEINPA